MDITSHIGKKMMQRFALKKKENIENYFFYIKITIDHHGNNQHIPLLDTSVTTSGGVVKREKDI